MEEYKAFLWSEWKGLAVSRIEARHEPHLAPVLGFEHLCFRCIFECTLYSANFCGVKARAKKYTLNG